MMLYSELHGTHEPNGGEGLTLQDLLELLRSIPRQARNNYVSVTFEDGTTGDVTGLRIGQSDQAEKWEFSVHVKYRV